ncbi:hypothetical protein ACFVYC_21355 [Pseudarthrobacter sp. NPDC058329]|uniref:hypothetical protein n=1 Tax=Pseudarthrobacter sp. NPDC058329 TaxID=3346448 RepID=UPI0036D9EE3C
MAQLKGTTPTRPVDDPLLRRMLATHIHCGEPMQLVPADTSSAIGSQENQIGGVLLAYRCACGFTFDKR